MDVRTDGKSHHSTGLCPLSEPLPRYSPTSTKNYIKRGKGTADHMMPLGDLFSLCLFISTHLHIAVYFLECRPRQSGVFASTIFTE